MKIKRRNFGDARVTNLKYWSDFDVNDGILTLSITIGFIAVGRQLL
jgi:hypothetical protein